MRKVDQKQHAFTRNRNSIQVQFCSKAVLTFSFCRSTARRAQDHLDLLQSITLICYINDIILSQTDKSQHVRGLGLTYVLQRVGDKFYKEPASSVDVQGSIVRGMPHDLSKKKINYCTSPHEEGSLMPDSPLWVLDNSVFHTWEYSFGSQTR